MIVFQKFIHTQTEGSTEWVIQHNLNRYPVLSVYVSGRVVVPLETIVINMNTVKLIFVSPEIGTAVIY